MGLPRLVVLGVGLALGGIGTLSLLGVRTAVDPPAAAAGDTFSRLCPRDDVPGRSASRGTGKLAGQRVVVAGGWEGAEATKFRMTLRRFELATGAEVQYVFKARDMAETIKARLLRDCPPDIALLPQPGLLAELAGRGALAPVDGFAGALLQDNYSLAWRRMAKVAGRSYGIWFKAANKSILWYSRGALKAAGVAPPATWDELMRVAARLAAVGSQPFSIAGQDGWTLTDWFENVYLRVAGARRYSELADGRIAWTHPTVRRALRTLSTILSKPKWVAGGTRGALTTSYRESVLDVFGSQPKAGMLVEGDFVLNELSPQQARDAGAAPFPSIDGSPPALVVGGDIAVLFAKHAHNRAARDLMRFLATPDAAEPWARSGGFISPNRRLDRRVYAGVTMRRLADAVVTTPTVRFDLSDLQPPAFGAKDGQGMWRTFRRYLANPADEGGVVRELEDAAGKAAACETAVGGEC